MPYFFVTDFNLQQTSDICRESGYACRETRLRSINGAPAIAYIPSVRSQLSKSISDAYVFTSRPIPLSSLRAAYISREPARHRNLFARTSGQALSLGYSRQYRQEHAGRCERVTRLAHLSGFCAQPNQTGTRTLFTRPLCRGVRADRLRTRYHDYRPVLECLSLGSLSPRESGGQDAYAARSARQYSNLHPHQRRQDARGQCARHPGSRSRQFLHHGSGLHRFRSLVHLASSAGVLRDSWQIQSTLPSRLLALRGQSHGAALRSDHCVDRSKGMQGLPSTPATHQVLRCRTRQASGLSDQQFRFTCSDYRTAISLPLAGRTILQVDQTASQDQKVLRHNRERSEDSNMDCHHGLRLGRYREKAPQHRGFALHNITDFKPHSFRENAARSTA